MEFDALLMGNRIRKRREELHLTREQLAEMLDVIPKFCCDIETGAKGMSLKTLMNISKLLYMSTDYILFGDEKAPTPFVMFAQEIPADQCQYYLRICKEIHTLTKITNNTITEPDQCQEHSDS